MFSAQSSLPGPLSDPIGPRPPNPEPHTHPVANQKSSRKRKKQQPRQPPPAKNCLRSTIDILEEAANRTTSLDHPLDTNRRQANSNIPSTEPCPPNHSGPLEGLHEALNALAPKRNGKRFRTREEDGRSRQSQPMLVEEVLSHTVANLVAFARERSKGAMSEADRAFFVNYFEEQRKLLVSKAIEQEVSMEMVAKFLGTRKAVRPPNKWNRFLQQLSARKKFRGVGKGVAGHRLGMREVSLLYKQYNTRKQPPRTSGSPTTNPASRSPSPEPELTPSKLALDNDLDVEEALNPQSNPPLSSQLRGPVSLSKAESQVEAFLANWVNQANSIAQTCNCEMIVFAVSTHLGRHSFQLTKSTHRALPFVELADEVDQPTTYPARFQASLVGTSALDLAKHNKPARRSKKQTTPSIIGRGRTINETLRKQVTNWLPILGCAPLSRCSPLDQVVGLRPQSSAINATN
ncbi:hypothetical protein PtB15_18B171 [Puccinia triticina]|nr:hypothetical protein PtB15_18B171 [Puccinia triticina]